MPTEGHGGGAGWSTVTSRGVVDMSFVEEIVEAYATVASWGGVTPYSLEEEDVRLGATLTSRGAGGETTEGLDWSGSGGNGPMAPAAEVSNPTVHLLRAAMAA